MRLSFDDHLPSMPRFSAVTLPAPSPLSAVVMTETFSYFLQIFAQRLVGLTIRISVPAINCLT